MSHQCWKCPEIFDTHRLLKTHGATKHSFLRVICPWCYEDNVEYKRTAELREHTKKRHPIEFTKLSSTFFSENNGFYLSTTPEDYSKLVKPTRWDSTDAQEARKWMLQWAQASKKPSKTDLQLVRGWEPENTVDTISLYSNVSSIDDQSESSRISKPDTEPETVYIEEVVQIIEENYNPERPEIKEPTLEYISMVPGEVTVEYTCHLDRYRASIQDTIFIDPKGLSNLARRMTALKNPTSTRSPSEKVYKLSGNHLKEQMINCVRLLGIEEKHISTIKRTELELFKYTATPLTQHTDNKENQMPMMPPNKKPSTMSTVPLSPVITVRPSPLLSLAPPKTLLQTHNKTEVISSADSHITPKPVQKPVQREVLTVGMRAKKLLEFGCMPLIPPARRNWDREQVLKIEGSDINWPPRNWKKMSPDQRKLVWEFTATTLESRKTPMININRTDLLDRYNFIALPGTSEDGKHSEDKVRSKARYYNYENLRNLALKKNYNYSKEEKDLVDMLEKAAVGRDRNLDNYIHQLNRYGIPLRLED